MSDAAQEQHDEGKVGDQTDAAKETKAPLGGDEATEEQLEAHDEVEEDTLRTLNPDDPA